MTAICASTNNTPATVCSSAGVQAQQSGWDEHTESPRRPLPTRRPGRTGNLDLPHRRALHLPALLACPEGVTINCAKVTSSPYSMILGIPVAALGLGYFLVMTALLTPAAWARRRLDPARIVWVVAGVVMVLYLVWVELFQVNALCLWCTGIHLCTLLLLATVPWRTTSREHEPNG